MGVQVENSGHVLLDGLLGLDLSISDVLKAEPAQAVDAWQPR